MMDRCWTQEINKSDLFKEFWSLYSFPSSLFYPYKSKQLNKISVKHFSKYFLISNVMAIVFNDTY